MAYAGRTFFTLVPSNYSVSVKLFSAFSFLPYFFVFCNSTYVLLIVIVIIVQMLNCTFTKKRPHIFFLNNFTYFLQQISLKSFKLTAITSLGKFEVNQAWLSGVFRRYEMGILARNGLIKLSIDIIYQEGLSKFDDLGRRLVR